MNVGGVLKCCRLLCMNMRGAWKGCTYVRILLYGSVGGA